MKKHVIEHPFSEGHISGRFLNAYVTADKPLWFHADCASLTVCGFSVTVSASLAEMGDSR